MKWLTLLCTILFSLTVINNNALGLNNDPLNSKKTPVNMPEFTHKANKDWINSTPLSVKELKGKVILIDFWTFDCWNCYRSFPWLNVLERKYQKLGLQIIGVHSPEFDHEKIRSNIEEKTREFKLHHPIMIDNDFSYWRALNNRYWPSYYLVDQQGRIVYSHVGETHQGDSRALALEKKLKELLSGE